MNKVTKDALTLIVFSAVAAIASYFYTFIMARMLSIEEYSLLYSLIALTYVLSIPQETIRTVVSVYTAKYESNNEKGKIKGLINKFLKFTLISSIISFIVFLAVSPLLAGVFHTDFWTLLVAGTVLLIAFILPVFWGLYQGLGKFRSLGINNSIEGLLKLGSAIILVLLVPIGYKLYGALLAAPISMIAAFLIAYLSLGYFRKVKEIKIKEKLTKYSIATLIMFGLVTIMYSIDIILARYFFSPKTSGIYAGISLLCKAFFFIATGTKRAMVPNLADKNGKRQEEECTKVLKKVSIMMAILFVAAGALFWLFPETIVSLVLGTKYLAAAPYLKYMIIAIALFSFSNLLVYYNLSLNKNKKMTIRILASAAFLEIVLLILFHKEINQVVLSLIVVYSLLFLAMVIITIIHPRQRERQRIEFMKLKRLFNKPHKSIKR